MDSLDQMFSQPDWTHQPHAAGEFAPVEPDPETAPLPDNPPRWRSLGGAVAAACLVLAAFFGVGGAGAISTPDAPVITARPIEQIAVGQKVLVDSPAAEQDLAFGREVDPHTWRHAQFLMPEPSGGHIRIDLLRPAVWFGSLGAEVGRTVHLALPEIGPDGPAQLVALGPCPEIQAGPGYVVTGTFAHESDDVLNLYIAGVDGPLGATRTHLMYSADRQEFVPAGELREGERLSLREGPARITEIKARPGTHRVYNLEVHVAHVYHVTEAGVLVHNTCPQVGQQVWRSWGGGSGPWGRSWTPVNPQGSLNDYRNFAGLPPENAGTFISQGTLTNVDGIIVRPARPVFDSVGGFWRPGGWPEYVIPNPPGQIDIDDVFGPIYPGL